MIPLDDPLAQAILKAEAEGSDPAAGMALVDLCMERGATLADGCLLFAGSPPDHLDGIRQETLAVWIGAVKGPEVAKAVGAEEYQSPEKRFVLEPHVRLHGFEASRNGELPYHIRLDMADADGKNRHTLWAGHLPTPTLTVNDLLVFGGTSNQLVIVTADVRTGTVVVRLLTDDEYQHLPLYFYAAPAVRELKRRVLALPCFLDVTVERELRGRRVRFHKAKTQRIESGGLLADEMYVGSAWVEVDGQRYDGFFRIDYSTGEKRIFQRLPPAQLIAPEPQPNTAEFSLQEAVTATGGNIEIGSQVGIDAQGRVCRAGAGIPSVGIVQNVSLSQGTVTVRLLT